MKTLKKGETSRKETIIDTENSVAECHHASAHPSLPDGARFQVHWSISFDECSPEQILRAAAEYCIIAGRRGFVKDPKPADKDWTDCTIMAKSLIPEPVSKMAKARKALDAFSPEELAEMGIVLS